MTTIHLTHAMFPAQEMVLAESGDLQASVFRYETGVEAVRLSNGEGELIILPFQGQQVWSANFGGRELTMRSMFDQPRATRNYLETYGGFLLHCGFTAMGVPAEGDTHLLHGELPNAPYDSAVIIIDEDENGPFIRVSGSYQYTVAFSYNYVANPQVTLHAGAQTFNVTMEVTNLKQTPMDYMYMAHVNFRPVDDGRLIYSAPSDPEHVRVRRSIPSHVKPGPDFVDFLDALAAQPSQHEVLRADLAFDPEVVFFIDYLADETGWAHTLQQYPDGTADYIRHRPAQLDKGVRWICRTPDQGALGMVLPATAEPEGLSAERAKGNVKTLGAGETFVCELEMGFLDESATAAMTAKIAGMLDS